MPLYNCAGSNGGGGGGTSDYEQLSNLPQVNNNILIGNKSASDLGLVGAVVGKGLSTNDYTDADKAIVGGVTSALADKVDKVTGKGLSTNDYDNTAKGIVDGVTSALAGKVSTTSVGSANGVAELDANGKVPSSQLPSYVDDTVEGYLNSVDGKFYADSSYTTEIAGETGKIYVTLDTNKTYRWSGSGFVEISESLALGETSSTAYAGNKGKANADAIAAMKNGTNIDSFGDVETALSGKANSSDLGDKSNLTTTDKSSAVAAINEVKAYQTRHYGTPVEITSASTSNLYTCPSDGFVTAEVNNSSDTSALNVIDYDLNIVLIASGGTGGQHQIRNGCNVIKGQRLYNNIVNAPGAKVQFIPLVNS